MDYGISKSNIASPTNYYDLNGLQSIKQEKNEEQALKKVAKQFESLFMHEILKSMRKANEVFEEGGLFSSSESKMFRDMYDQQLSVELSKKNGLGIGDVLYRQLSKQYLNNHSSPTEQGDLHFSRPEVKQAERAVRSYSNSTDQVHSPSAAKDRPIEDQFKSPKDFIETTLPMAKQVAKVLGLNPMILIAQAALETGWGQYMVQDERGKGSNNLFNIKADQRWSGDVVTKEALEYRDGIAQKEHSRFRSYESLQHSFEDFLHFLQTNPRYHKALEGGNDEGHFVAELQRAGYATDPNYAQKVLSVYQNIVTQYQPSLTSVD